MIIISREARPMIPDQVKVNNVLYGTSIQDNTNDIVFSWKNRNRLTQNKIVKNSLASVAVETNTTTTIKIYARNGSLLATRSNITGDTFTYTVAMQATDVADAETGLTFVIYSVRDGHSSFKAVKLNVARPSAALPTNNPTYTPSGVPETNVSPTSLVQQVQTTTNQLQNDVSSVYSDINNIQIEVNDHDSRISLLEQ